MSIELMMPPNHLVLCCPLLLLPSIFPSIRVFSNESVLHIRWPKYWSFSFSISPFHEYSGLISFRTDWLDLLAVQVTLKSLFQHHSLKVSVLWRSAFFTVQLSHSHMNTRKTIALTVQTFFGKVMSLLFNMLSRLVIKMISNLENKMKLQINRLEMRIEKMSEIFDTDLEEIKKSQPIMNNAISSVQLLSVSDSLQPHGLQHTRPPCPSPTPGVYSNSCPLSR